MNNNDLDTRINVRLTSEQYEFLETMAEMTGLSSSEYLRMMINTTMVQFKKMTAAMTESNKVNVDENVKTD